MRLHGIGDGCVGLDLTIGCLGSLTALELVHGWLTAKVFGLIAYIVLGTIALKRGRTPGIRTAAFCGALLVFAYIVAVAMSKSPVPLG